MSSNSLSNMHAVTSAYKAVLTPTTEDSFRKGSALKQSKFKLNENAVVVRKRTVVEKPQTAQTDDSNRTDSDFSAEDFVDLLLNKGCDVICDETSASFNEQNSLPPYYNEELYKRGQDFFYKHIFGLFFSKLLGLILLLTLPTVKILIMTNKSSTPLTAYKRYMATIFHMCLWYDEDFKPNSRIWSSLRKVKNMHNSASNQSSNKLNIRISQKDMALTQFGFMGLGLVRSKMVGVHEATEDEWKAFIHVWRVVGYVLGMEDRFNICRESVSETRQICNLLIEKAFNPLMENPNEDFERMSKTLLKGMWVMNPYLQYDVFVCYLCMTLANSNYDNLENDFIKPLAPKSKSRLNVIIFVIGALRFTVVRLFYKYLQILSLWLMKNFPFLAYYRYGKDNSRVTI